MTQIKLRLFGPPRLERDGVPVRIETRKAMALLAHLVLAEAARPREALIGLLWPDFDQTHAQGDLRRALSTLRKALGEDALDSTRQTIQLNHEHIWVDVCQFRALLKETTGDGRRTMDNRRLSSVVGNARSTLIQQLEEAAALWHDEFMAGFSLRDSAEFDDWQAREAEHLRNEVSEVLQQLTQLHSEGGNTANAIPHARRWLGLDPLREEAQRTLMRLYVQAGRRADALKQYQDCERVLANELGVQPLAETTALYHAIKDNQPAQTRPLPDTPVTLPSLNKLPLVGREREWAGMLGAQQAWQTQGYWIAIEGEPGIGKTRLLDEYAAHAAAIGQHVLRARCYEGEGALAHEPLVQALRQVATHSVLQPCLHNLPAHWRTELTRLLPELGSVANASSPSIFDAGARARLFEAIRQALLAARTYGPLVFALDDLHWADTSTVDVLIYLTRRLTDTGIALLTTWRSEDNENTRRLQQALAEVQRAGHALHLAPERLSAAHVAQLCQASTHSGSGLEQRLHQDSEGVPLLIVEYLNALLHAPAASTSNWPLPTPVREVLRARVERLEQVERQVLQTAAVIGRSFDAGLTQRASGRSDEEVAQALEALSARGIVREVPGPDAPLYDFAHDKLREVVYDNTNLARRMLLHLRVAQSITAAPGKRKGAEAGKAARHFEAAGKPAEAAAAYATAGDYARQAFANAEALAHYRTALHLGHPLGQPEEARLREAEGDLLTLHGDYAEAIQSYRAAQSVSSSAHLMHALANVFARLGNWDEAETHFRTALQGSDTDVQQSQMLADWSRSANARGDAEQAHTLAQRALALAEAANAPHALAQAHNMLGMLARHRVDYELAHQHFARSLALAQQLAEPAMQVAAMNNLALTSRAAGDTTTALTMTCDALKLCEASGDRHREAALRSNLADLLREQGDIGAAMAQLKQSVIIFAEIGVASRGLQPEVWKLTEW